MGDVPYHPLGVEKAKKIGKPSPYGNPDFLPSSSLMEIAQTLQSQTNIKTTVFYEVNPKSWTKKFN